MAVEPDNVSVPGPVFVKPKPPVILELMVRVLLVATVMVLEAPKV